MSYRLSLAASLLASLVLCLPVVGQETPLTQLEPIKYHSGFLRDAVSRLWRIAPPKDYHQAAVKISCPTSAAGSGAIIATDKGLFVTTNHHVIEGCERSQVTILGQGGRKQVGTVIWWDSSADVAVVYAPSNQIAKGLPIYNGDVPVGQYVEVLGMGGPGRMNPDEDIRPFLGKRVLTSYSARLCVDAYTVSGDSGAAIVYQGGIVGVNWGHYHDAQNTVQGWAAGKPLASNVDGPWLARTITQQVCRPYGCAPVIIGPRVVSPPVSVSPPQMRPQPQPQPPTAACDCDEESIKQSIIDQLKNDLSLRGPQGPPGKDGMDGQEGAPGRDAVLTPGMIEQAVADYLAANPQTISLVLFDENGNEIDRDTTTIGGELKLQFFEVQ